MLASVGSSNPKRGNTSDATHARRARAEKETTIGMNDVRARVMTSKSNLEAGGVAPAIVR